MNPSNYTILIVDDELELAEAIAFDFRRKKFNVLTAASGREAFEKLNSTKVDMVLTDVRMPNGDGVELLDRVKAKNLLLPVVMFITGFSDITLKEAYDRGADAVFAKPFDRKALYEAVVSALQPLDRKIMRKNSRVTVNFPTEIHFPKSNFTIPTKVLNIERSGMFVSLTDRFPEKGEAVEFQIEATADNAFSIGGTGKVRWIQLTENSEGPSGCGIEFTHLEEQYVRELIELINFLKTKTRLSRK